MKTIIYPILILLTVVCWGSEKQPENPKVAAHIAAMKEDNTLKLVLDKLAEDGTICELRGHAWGEHLHTTLEYSPTRIGCRECKICFKHQEMHTSDWK